MSFVNEKLNKFNQYLNGKKVAIIGLGVSNLPLIDYLYDKNAKVTVFNNKELSEDIMKKINNYRYEVQFGEDNLSMLKGFDMIFRSPSCLPTRRELQEEAEKGTIITSEIEQVLKLSPSKIIGVTGTEGKTTTTSIIYEIIKQSGLNCFTGGNIGKPLFTSIKDMRPEDIVILELSSFQLSGLEISPNISIVTNIYPDHLNIHKSYEEYQDAKKNIFKFQDEKDILILNIDNEITKEFDKEAKSKVMFFSSKKTLNNGYFYDNSDGFIKKSRNGIVTNVINRSEIKLRGIHNYENICAALAATESIVSDEQQIKAIKNFVGVEHRLEFVRELEGVKYYNDSIGTSPASTLAGLNSFDENIVLLAGGADKGLDYTEIGEKIAEKVGTLILSGPTAQKIEKATRKGLEKLKSEQNVDKRIEIIYCKNMEEAVKLAKLNAKEGDIVLLSPASTSFDAFKNFEERGNKFKELVNKL